MKAVRRHQLKDNELAKQLETFPEMLKRNANKIMLAITAIFLIIFFVRYRMQAAENRRQELANAMITLRQGPIMLRQFDAQPLPPEALALRRSDVSAQTQSAIDTVLRDAEGDQGAALRAEALISRGDLNWMQANLTPIPGAATQPSLRPSRSSDDHLKLAEEAYREVANNYSGQIVSWVSAQFGLAAIAENRREWEAARATYVSIVDNKSVPRSFQQVAQMRIAILPQLQGPILLGSYPATAPSTAPSTGPSPALTATPSITQSTPSTSPSASDSFSLSPTPTTQPAPSTSP